MHNAMVMGTLIIGFLLLFMHLAGVLGRAVMPNLSTGDLIIPSLMLELLPPFWAGIFVAGPLAAIMSTVDTMLLLVSAAIIKDLYIVGVTEYDMTYSEKISKTAGEIGWRIQYDLRDGVQLSTDGYYRDYFSFSKYIGTDLEYDFNANARMDVTLVDNLAFGP